MAHEELTILHNALQQATSSEDLFGIPQQISLQDKTAMNVAIKEIYYRLAKSAHPDYYSDEEAKKLAAECFALLQDFYQKALLKIDRGQYGQGFQDIQPEDSQFIITTGKRKYHIQSTLAQGDLATVYGGVVMGGEDDVSKIAIKLVEDPADNDLFRNEINMLKFFSREASIYSKHLPTILDEFKTSDDKLGIIFRQIDGYDLYSIREKYRQGVEPQHIIWIFRRALSVLGYVHSKGIIHGNLEPAHIMVRPRDHNVYLIDWCYSIWKPKATGQGFKCLNEDYSPPEVAARKPPIPASDLYSLAKCMIFLLGGDIKTNTMPATVDERIQRFIKFFVKESAIQRAQDAWEMYHQLDKLREEIFGPHRFLEFIM